MLFAVLMGACAHAGAKLQHIPKLSFNMATRGGGSRKEIDASHREHNTDPLQKGHSTDASLSRMLATWHVERAHLSLGGTRRHRDTNTCTHAQKHAFPCPGAHIPAQACTPSQKFATQATKSINTQWVLQHCACASSLACSKCSISNARHCKIAPCSQAAILHTSARSTLKEKDGGWMPKAHII